MLIQNYFHPYYIIYINTFGFKIEYKIVFILAYKNLPPNSKING